jgi:elongation of very long chain fatty acids protein 6
MIDYGQDPVDGVYRSKCGLNYTTVAFFERKFFDADYVQDKRQWMSDNWYLSIVYSLFYVIIIFGGQQYMKNRQKYDLRKALVAWNLSLAVFSVLGAIRMWPEFIYGLTNHGVQYTACNNNYTHGVTGCWSWYFILSKVPELFDTAFIVLRKQHLIFLHWYHHATVLIYCWFSGREFAASGRWFVVMNYTVHAFMYGYYAMRALRFQIPKFVNIAITTGQISQMIFGIYVNITVYQAKKRGDPCSVSDENVIVSFLMYASYFALFFHFFYLAYIKKSPKKVATKQNGVKQNGHHTNGTANGVDPAKKHVE